MTTTPTERPTWGLTPRELDILTAIAGDTTDAAVADMLGLSVETVHKHVARIRRKLGVTTRTGAVVKAMRARVIA